ncbi:hypothetical protein EUX98_g855 [Antrodiella citrinella]|uniref:Uncharacterized protein n=1 Tax=Antrodiella citrinella TaxID=2447956 RepID=A0A4S4N5F0_9APHY|nr:hypothetical protein EUX98_g855 [Antrodiella citrinella]
MADTALQLAVDALAEAPGGDKPSAKGKGKKKAVIDVDDPALEWRKGGSARRDWEERTRRGEAKRQELLQGWEGMLPPQFLAIKQQMDT